MSTALVWTLVLPQIAEREPISSRMQFFAERGVDPAALYYTDIEAMERLAARVDAARLQHPEFFWKIMLRRSPPAATTALEE
jgi:hypothetical protein